MTWYSVATWYHGKQNTTSLANESYTQIICRFRCVSYFCLSRKSTQVYMYAYTTMYALFTLQGTLTLPCAMHLAPGTHIIHRPYILRSTQQTRQKLKFFLFAHKNNSSKKYLVQVPFFARLFVSVRANTSTSR